MNKRNIDFSVEPSAYVNWDKFANGVIEIRKDDTVGVKEIAEYLQIGRTKATDILKRMMGSEVPKQKRGYLRISREKFLSHVYASNIQKEVVS